MDKRLNIVAKIMAGLFAIVLWVTLGLILNSVLVTESTVSTRWLIMPGAFVTYVLLYTLIDMIGNKNK